MPGARVADGERVTLRTTEREDLPFLQRAYANPELRVPLGWDLKRRADLEAEFEEGRHDEQFLVCLDDDAGPGDAETAALRRAGCVAAATSERARSSVAFWLAPAVHGEGHGQEAVALVLEYLFRTYPHPAVAAQALPHNDASRGLLESLGFREEGRRRKVAFWDGAYHDAVAYSLLREEWRADD